MQDTTRIVARGLRKVYPGRPRVMRPRWRSSRSISRRRVTRWPAWSARAAAGRPPCSTYFGIGEASKIGPIFMAAFWYVVLNCADCVRAVPQLLIRAGENIGLSRRQLLTHVIIPASMPAIMTALRAASAIS